MSTTLTPIQRYENLLASRNQANTSLATFQGQLTAVEKQFNDLLNKNGVTSLEELQAKLLGLETQAEVDLGILETENCRVEELLQRLSAITEEFPTGSA
jgi:hypothetical protein